MENYLTELKNSMNQLIGRKVKLVNTHGVEWVGYEYGSIAYIIGVDDDAFFDVSYDQSAKDGWKADLNEIELI